MRREALRQRKGERERTDPSDEHGEDDTEDEMIRNFANVLPEFREMDGDEWCKALTQAKKIWIRYDQNVKTSLQALTEIKSETIRKKAFVLAVDMTMSSGEIDRSPTRRAVGACSTCTAAASTFRAR